MTFSGKVEFRDLEGGLWVLRADDGRSFLLTGGDRKLKQDGRAVEVEGEVEETTVSAGMIGAVLNVRKYRFT